MTYTTTYIQGIGNCGAVVKQGLRWEGVGMSDIVEITKMGNVFGVAEKFTRYYCRQKMRLSYSHGERKVVNALFLQGLVRN